MNREVAQYLIFADTKGYPFKMFHDFESVDEVKSFLKMNKKLVKPNIFMFEQLGSVRGIYPFHKVVDDIRFNLPVKVAIITHLSKYPEVLKFIEWLLAKLGRYRSGLTDYNFDEYLSSIIFLSASGVDLSSLQLNDFIDAYKLTKRYTYGTAMLDFYLVYKLLGKSLDRKEMRRLYEQAHRKGIFEYGDITVNKKDVQSRLSYTPIYIGWL